MQRKESSLLGSLGTAAAMHVAPNVALKAARSTGRGRKILADTARAGWEHGKSGKKLSHGVERSLRLGLGPESLSEYQLGRKAGQVARKGERALSRKTTKEQYKSIDRAKRIISKPENVKKIEERESSAPEEDSCRWYGFRGCKTARRGKEKSDEGVPPETCGSGRVKTFSKTECGPWSSLSSCWSGGATCADPTCNQQDKGDCSEK